MRLLDLFCGAGGAAVGYHRAGFDDIVGVDINPQPRYPFRFVQADALAYLAWHGHEFDAVHASPPCQAYSTATGPLRTAGKEYPDLVAVTRRGLQHRGRPWVIENVPGAPVRPDVDLCGCMFPGLRVKRRRWFECSWPILELRATCHHYDRPVDVSGHSERGDTYRRHGRGAQIADKRAAMGIDWMTRDELSQAIPPVYTEHVGRLMLDYLTVAA